MKHKFSISCDTALYKYAKLVTTGTKDGVSGFFEAAGKAKQKSMRRAQSRRGRIMASRRGGQS